MYEFPFTFAVMDRNGLDCYRLKIGVGGEKGKKKPLRLKIFFKS